VVVRFGGNCKNLLIRGHILDKIVVVSNARIYLKMPLGMVSEEQLEQGNVGQLIPSFSAAIKPFFRAVARVFWDIHASQGRTGLHLPRKFQDLLALLLCPSQARRIRTSDNDPDSAKRTQMEDRVVNDGSCSCCEGGQFFFISAHCPQSRPAVLGVRDWPCFCVCVCIKWQSRRH